MKIRVANDRTVFPSSIKIANQYESDTRTIDFDLSKVKFHGNAYLILKYRASSEYFTPLLIGESMAIPVKTFMSAKEGTYDALIAISTVEISEDYDFSQDNPMFISNVFQVIVEDNFLTGTSTSWQLTPAAQNYFDQLIALVEKVQSDLDSGAFVGNGIQSIAKISTSGLVDTYQITFTNGSTFDYQVTNGQDGQTPTITIQDGYWYINGVNTGQQAQGDKGEPGDNATINVGAVTTLEPGQEATVTNTGSETNAVLAFGIPKGEKGDKGDKGETGDNATIAIGTVTTLEPDQEATVQNTGTETNAVLSFGIPKGVQGDTGPQGPQGAPGVNENILHSDISKSENPSVDDAYEAPLQDLKLYGKSTQESTTGKNLLNPNNYGEKTSVDAQMTCRYDSEEDCFILNGSVTNSIAFTDETFKLKAPSKYYVVSVQYLSGDFFIPDSGSLCAYFGKSKDGISASNWLDSPNIAKQTVQRTSNLEAPYIKNFWFYITQGVTCNNLKVRVQLEVGKTATAYEPYTGGAPSPSPDYPQEITKIEKVDCNVVGKNLYDSSQYQGYTNVNGMTIQYDSDEDCFILNGTCTKAYGFRDDPFIRKANSTNYTISVEYLSGEFSIPDSGYLVAYFGKSTDGTDRTNWMNTPNITKQTVQQTGLLDMPYIDGFWFYITEGVMCTNLKVRVQLEVGTTATAYEPYQSQHVQFTPPAPLYSLLDGSVADYVDVARGKYVYQLADVTFDGSEDEVWAKNNRTDYTYQTVKSDIAPVAVSDGSDILSDRFVAMTSGSSLTNGQFRRGGGGGANNVLVFRYDGLSTNDLDGWKTFLQSNNVFVVYQLSTATEQDIPAETLEALQALKTFNGVTNIFCNAPVSAQYEQSVQIVMNKILEQLNSLQTQTLSLQEEMINNV